VCIVDNDVTTNDLLRASAFALVSQSLRPRDTIEVFAANNRKYWELVVLDGGVGWVRVHLRKEETWSHDGQPGSQVPRTSRAVPDQGVQNSASA
jgi:hypothetical protein